MYRAPLVAFASAYEFLSDESLRISVLVYFLIAPNVNYAVILERRS